MAGPTTSLAERIDKIHDGLDEIRRSGINDSRRLGDIFADQIQDVREDMVRELTLLRNEVSVAFVVISYCARMAAGRSRPAPSARLVLDHLKRVQAFAASPARRASVFARRTKVK